MEMPSLRPAPGPSLGGSRCRCSVRLRAPPSGDRDAAAPFGSETGGQFPPSPSTQSPPTTSHRRSVRLQGWRPVPTFALHSMSTNDIPPSSDVDAIILWFLRHFRDPRDTGCVDPVMATASSRWQRSRQRLGWRPVCQESSLLNRIGIEADSGPDCQESSLPNRIGIEADSDRNRDNEKIDASAKKSKKKKSKTEADGDAMDLDKPSNAADGEAEPGTEKKKKKKKHKLEEETQEQENGAANGDAEVNETPKKKKKKSHEVSEEAEPKTATEEKKKKKKKSKAEDDE